MWIKLDDGFMQHPKVVAAGPHATLLHIAGLCYCGRYLTDGFVPAAQVRLLTAAQDPDALVRRLYEVNLWERAPGGHFIHDFAKYNPTKAEVEQARAMAAQRMAAWRERQRQIREGEGGERGGGSTGDRVTANERGTNGEQTAPRPSPVPSTSRPINSSTSVDRGVKTSTEVTVTHGDAGRVAVRVKGQRPYTPEFEDFWSAYIKKKHKYAAFEQYEARRREGVDAADLLAAARNHADAKEIELRHGETEMRYVEDARTFLSAQQRRYLHWLEPGAALIAFRMRGQVDRRDTKLRRSFAAFDDVARKLGGAASA
jgi:hypothetical protein